MKNTTACALAGSVGALVTLVLMLGVGVLADGLQSTDQTPKYIGYHGTLEKDGVALNASVQMKFEIFDGAATVAAKWSETQSVAVYGGRFSVMLGSTTADSVNNLTAAVKSADDLYLAVSIKSGDTWITLSGKQRFLPTPYATWTTASTDLTTSSINGLSTASLLLNNATGKPVDFGGNLAIYGPDISFKNHPDRGDGGIAIVHGTGDRLLLNFAGQLGGGTMVEGQEVGATGGGAYTSTLEIKSGSQHTYMDGNEIDSDGKLFINGNSLNEVSFGGHISGAYLTSCKSAGCGGSAISPPGGGPFGQWYDWSFCPNGTFLCGLRLKVEPDQGSGGDDTAMNNVEGYCCPF